jgi:hypothetical protein
MVSINSGGVFTFSSPRYRDEVDGRRGRTPLKANEVPSTDGMLPSRNDVQLASLGGSASPALENGGAPSLSGPGLRMIPGASGLTTDMRKEPSAALNEARAAKTINALSSFPSRPDLRDRLFEAADKAQYRGTDNRPEAERGVSSPQAIRAAAADMKALQKDWPTLSPKERQDRYAELINKRLTAAGVHEVTVKDEPGLARGKFSPDDWSFKTSLPKTSTLSDADAAELLDTAVHEGVHAEQDFLMARELSASGRKLNGFSPAALADAEKKNKAAPLTVAQEEYAKALIAGIPAGGMEQYSDAVGASFKAYEAKQTEVQQVVAELRKNPTKANLEKADKLVQELQEKEAEAGRAYEAYRRYGYEADAHGAGAAARNSLGAP